MQRERGTTLEPARRGTDLDIPSATEVVYRELRSEILKELEPGSSLRLNEVADRLGVSITPVRAALERLAAEGLVLHERRRGAVVAPLSLDDLMDIYAIRGGLEGVAARVGAPLLTDEDVASMDRYMGQLQMLRSRRPEDLDEYLRLEWAMHEVCYAAAGHHRLLREIRLYRRQAERYLRVALNQQARMAEDMVHQESFRVACVARDGVRAEAAATLLLEWTVGHVGAALRELHG